MVSNTATIKKGSAPLAIKNWTRLAWVSLALYAWASVLTGANLPEIRSTFGLGSSVAGFLASIPAIGFITAGLIGGFLSRWIGLQRLLALSASGLTLSLLLAAISPSGSTLFLAALCIGFFGGMLETGSNGLIADLYRGNAARELNRLHIFFGTGAFISPLVVAALLASKNTWRYSYTIASFMAILITIILVFQPKPSSSKSDLIHLREFTRLAHNPNISLAWLGAFFFNASEMGLSNWIVTYFRQKTGFTPELASLGLSIFWLSILLGRYINTRLPHVGKDQYIIVFEAFGSSLFIILVLTFQTIVLSILALIMVGIFMAGLYPWLLAHACERNPGYAGSISGFVQSGVGAGMLIGPSLIGVLAQYVNLSFALGTTVIFIFILGLIFLLPEKSA
jgi:fucose permease